LTFNYEQVMRDWTKNVGLVGDVHTRWNDDIT